jgi:hypothetical protein
MHVALVIEGQEGVICTRTTTLRFGTIVSPAVA